MLLSLVVIPQYLYSERERGVVLGIDDVIRGSLTWVGEKCLLRRVICGERESGF